jgi:hypothetical protein
VGGYEGKGGLQGKFALARFLAANPARKTVVTAVNQNPFSIEIRPNPVQDILHVAYDLPLNENMDIYITDLTGKLVKWLGTNVVISKGYHFEYYNLNGIANGLYLLNFVSKTGKVAMKFEVMTK